MIFIDNRLDWIGLSDHIIDWIGYRYRLPNFTSIGLDWIGNPAQITIIHNLLFLS